MHTYGFRKLAYWRNIGKQKFLDALSRSIVSVIARRIKSLNIIIIVAPKQCLERVRSNFENRIENIKAEFFAEIQYVAEEDLR